MAELEELNDKTGKTQQPESASRLSHDASPHFSPRFVARASRRRSYAVLGLEDGDGGCSRHPASRDTCTSLCIVVDTTLCRLEGERRVILDASWTQEVGQRMEQLPSRSVVRNAG